MSIESDYHALNDRRIELITFKYSTPPRKLTVDEQLELANLSVRCEAIIQALYPIPPMPPEVLEAIDESKRLLARIKAKHAAQDKRAAGSKDKGKGP